MARGRASRQIASTSAFRGRAYEGLEELSQGVHARLGGSARGQAVAQLGVDYGEARHHGGRSQADLYAVLGRGEDGVSSGLGACPRRRWDGYAGDGGLRKRRAAAYYLGVFEGVAGDWRGAPRRPWRRSMAEPPPKPTTRALPESRARARAARASSKRGSRPIAKLSQRKPAAASESKSGLARRLLPITRARRSSFCAEARRVAAGPASAIDPGPKMIRPGAANSKLIIYNSE